MFDKTQKLMIFFGGTQLKEREDKTAENETKIFTTEDIRKEEEERLKKIVEVLNKSGDVTNIKQLFKEPLDFANPIVFDIRVPLSLQKLRYESDASDVDYFTIVYDGYIMMVAAICPPNKRPWGVCDARDRFQEMLGAVGEIKEVPPCLTHEALVFSQADLKNENYPMSTFQSPQTRMF
jgi:hypothetical protein